MTVIGIDVGGSTTKIIAIRDGEILKPIQVKATDAKTSVYGAFGRYCNENDIQVMAYTPTGRMDQRLNKTVLVSIAQKYKKSVAQIILRWHQQIGNIPVVNSSNSKHVIENSEIYDFELNNDEINQILKININSRLRYDPDNCDFRKL